MTNDTRLIIRSGNVSFYSSVKDIKLGVGTNTKFNKACSMALADLTNSKSLSINDTFNDIPIQIDVYCLNLDKTP
jgi:hypothetical protein